MEGRKGDRRAPRHLAERLEVTKGMFGSPNEGYEPTAFTEAYLCATCGYVEEYVIDVASIDWTTVEGATVHG